MSTASQPFLFITGRPRTGTTLLRMLLDAHPNVIIPTECQFIINLYNRYGHRKVWTVGVLSKLIDDLLEQWKFDHWRITREMLEDQLLGGRSFDSFGAVCRAVYELYPSIFPKGDVLLMADKNPGYAIYTTKLKKVFPEARFIFITRDFRDNFVSIKESGLDLAIPSMVAQKWKYFYKTFVANSKKLPSDYLIISYEDLVSKPEETFKSVCHFASIPYSPNVFDFYKTNTEFHKIYDEAILHKMHQRVMEPISTSRKGLYENRLSVKEIQLLEATMGRMAGETGYFPKYEKLSCAIHLQAIPGRVLAALLRYMTCLINVFPVGLRMNILSRWPRKIGLVLFFVINRTRYLEMRKRTETKHS